MACAKLAFAATLTVNLALASAANAVTASFDFTNTAGESASMFFAQAGVAVTVTAGGTGADDGPPLVTGNLEGLGVISAMPIGAGLDNSRAVNTLILGSGGFGGFLTLFVNFLRFEFDQPIQLISLDFGGFDQDAFRLRIDSSDVGSSISDATGMTLEVSAARRSCPIFPTIGDPCHPNSSFFVAGMTVLTTSGAMPIPLPAALALYLAALGVLSLVPVLGRPGEAEPA